jgi:hypothetical protein
MDKPRFVVHDLTGDADNTGRIWFTPRRKVRKEKPQSRTLRAAEEWFQKLWTQPGSFAGIVEISRENLHHRDTRWHGDTQSST